MESIAVGQMSHFTGQGSRHGIVGDIPRFEILPLLPDRGRQRPRQGIVANVEVFEVGQQSQFVDGELSRQIVIVQPERVQLMVPIADTVIAHE